MAFVIGLVSFGIEKNSLSSALIESSVMLWCELDPIALSFVGANASALLTMLAVNASAAEDASVARRMV
ncbi:hypothetical protein F0L68_15990 [Solihabitans fulvus]|uniref:Uncharacterized protein n=1 Tax=Solihabitans fulvus TaxID=1892852 RepID=A0A5B2XET7_9PSEU|nr:hypothetical protein [Solihabitans fulvus]KAA2261579.1 hypothetical protein F0L68_15990 [Solihabitans fulvus]